MTTPSDIILSALKKAAIIGAGQNASDEDMNDAFDDLNMMLAQWQRKRWMIYHLVDVSKVSTGAQSYTVGPGGDFNVATRPDRLEAAFNRQLVNSASQNVDTPLTIIEARETYNQISLKTLGTFPYTIFYDSDFPLGRVYPWPVPQASIYEIHLTIKAQLNQFASQGQVISLPLEYFPALVWNLAVRLAISYGVTVTPGVIGLAKDSLNVIRNSNTQIPILNMPAGLNSRSRYNIFSDQMY